MPHPETNARSSTKSSPIVVIPARMASTRLPGKPLADIAGLPMIVQVLRRAEEADIGPVLVAAAEQEIVDAVTDADGRAVLTDPGLPSGSDRIHAALLEADPEASHDIVVNLQGDLPTIDPAIIADTLIPFANAPDSGPDITTLAAEITSDVEIGNPNVVKVAAAFADSAKTARALYFSRQAVPAGEGPHWHHIGIYAYRRAALDRFVSLPPGLLEMREKLEQLRALEAGMRIDVVRAAAAPTGVDTPEDLEAARAELAK